MNDAFGSAGDGPVEEFPVGPVDGELLDVATSDEVDADADSYIDGEFIDADDDADEVDVTDGATAQDTDATPGMVLDTWQIQIPATGDATVDAALARLADVEGLPPTQHVDVYEAVHAGLHEALADLDRS